MFSPASIAPHQRRGVNSLSLASNGTNQIIVASGSNTNGLIIRTAFILSGASAGQKGLLRVDGFAIFGAAIGGNFNLLGPAFYVRPAVELSFFGPSGAAELEITWDAL